VRDGISNIQWINSAGILHSQCILRQEFKVHKRKKKKTRRNKKTRRKKERRKEKRKGEGNKKRKKKIIIHTYQRLSSLFFCLRCKAFVEEAGPVN
jgi:hypothetical protein